MAHKYAWFPVFRKVVPADFEEWAENQALNGWSLDRVGQFSSLLMRFTKAAPRQYRYVFDLNAFPKKD